MPSKSGSYLLLLHGGTPGTCSPASVETSQWRALSSSWWLPGCMGRARTVTPGTWFAMYRMYRGMSLDTSCTVCTTFFPHFQETHLPRRARWWATCSTPWRVWCTRRSPSWHHERWSVNWTRMGVARVLQLIGFLGTFLTGTPHIEWDNLWFPVKIALKPIHVWVCYKHFPMVIS